MGALLPDFRQLGETFERQGRDAAVAQLREADDRYTASLRNDRTGGTNIALELEAVEARPDNWHEQQLDRLMSFGPGNSFGNAFRAGRDEATRQIAREGDERAAALAREGTQRFREMDAALQRQFASAAAPEPAPLAAGPDVELTGVSTGGDDEDNLGNPRRRRAAYQSNSGINI